VGRWRRETRCGATTPDPFTRAFEAAVSFGRRHAWSRTSGVVRYQKKRVDLVATLANVINRIFDENSFNLLS
jgi:hypothetical protein